jgi:hypothetical protein
MTIEEIKKTANELLLTNHEECMNYLLRYLLPKSDTYISLIALCSQFNHRKMLYMRGVLDSKEYSSEIDKIFGKLSPLIPQIQEKDLNHAAIFQKGIHEKILVVCSTDGAVKNTRQLFAPDIFTHLTFKTTGEISDWKAELSAFRLLIFANFYETSSAYEENLKDKILDKDLHPVFYFGRPCDIVVEYPEEVYASNSKFSLYIRVKELLEYLNEHYKDKHHYPYSMK